MNEVVSITSEGKIAEGMGLLYAVSIGILVFGIKISVYALSGI